MEYNQRIRKKYEYKRDVLSGVFHLGNDAPLEPSPLVWGTPLQQWYRTLEFRYPAVEMGYLTPRGIRRLGRKALLPLLPLTERGAEWDVVRGMLHDLECGDRELLKIGFGMAMQRVPEEEQESLRKEYEMIYQELMEDQFYRYLVNDGVRQGIPLGIQQGIQKIQEGLINLVARNFPKLEALAQTKFAAVNSLDRLQQLMQDLYLLRTQEEVEQFLLQLSEDQSNEV